MAGLCQKPGSALGCPKRPGHQFTAQSVDHTLLHGDDEQVPPHEQVPTFSFIFLSLRAILSQTRSMLAYRLSSTSSARTFEDCDRHSLCCVTYNGETDLVLQFLSWKVYQFSCAQQ